jgi:hypothetical protein
MVDMASTKEITEEFGKESLRRSPNGGEISETTQCLIVSTGSKK